MTSAQANGSHGLDLEHRRQAASRAFYKQTGQLILKVWLHRLPMEMFGCVEHKSNADRCMADTSSRVEPVRQKMAGPIGHRREKEMKCGQIAKYI